MRCIYQDDVCVEGWLILASKEVMGEILQLTQGQLVRLKAVVRNYRSEDEGSKEFSVCRKFDI